jgi:hypothetical protein
MDLVHHVGLDELGLRDRCGDLEDRLVGEDRRPLGHRVHVPAEAEVPEPAQEPVVELSERGQIVQILAREAQLLQVPQHVVEAAGEQVVPSLRQPAHEQTEGRRLVHVLLDIGLQHGELVRSVNRARCSVSERSGLVGIDDISSLWRWERCGKAIVRHDRAPGRPAGSPEEPSNRGGVDEWHRS